MDVFKSLADWRTALAFLLGLLLSAWLSPLPIASIILLFVACFALVYLVAAIVGKLHALWRRR
ncbi:hypothetical protein [Sphingobium sp.]|uniref:hypothetical protein n=1 Tax=Sphingobium sp. TaxID=1912891 RepID=UPI002CCBC94B|nr:hypothetical protein [Sphingobium sp.]HUD93873.1 hypothetical protein [Sphingobium sp.]